MPEFKLFGLTHILTLSVIGGAVVLLTWLYKAHPSLQKKIRWALAACVLASYPLQILSAAYFGYHVTLDTTLPLHLCDLAAIFGGIALLTQSQRCAEITYFWGLAGTLQGLLTPNIQSGFPSPEYLCFFWNHGFVVITALFLPLAIGWKPRKNAMWFVFGLTQVYLVLALTTNFSLHTNYGYLRHKPDTASLLDFFPSWPWYILVLEAICLFFFFLLSLPFSRKSVK
ncbi:TIGR02206 family membrane protein [Rubritalea tangerina]|uniref:TIGR02206 family membrane protein n=1 Tax=Rubritalea tangerina TaxID=430798 RepID=A0ABW4ZD18_9BACT